MGSEVTTTVGRVPIPFGRFSGYGRAASSGLASFGRFGTFAGADQLAILSQAMDRYRAAALSAEMMCEERFNSPAQMVFEWITNSTFTGSICDRAAQMKVNIDQYQAKIDDPNTTEAQISEILGFIQRETDIHDLVDLYNASGAGHIVGESIDPRNLIPTAAGLIPWWGWALGAVFLASQLGWNPLKKGK
jgi:hypothetical protein